MSCDAERALGRPPRNEEAALLVAAVADIRSDAIDALAGAYEGGERAALQEIARQADRALRLTIQKIGSRRPRVVLATSHRDRRHEPGEPGASS